MIKDHLLTEFMNSPPPPPLETVESCCDLSCEAEQGKPVNKSISALGISILVSHCI